MSKNSADLLDAGDATPVYFWSEIVTGCGMIESSTKVVVVTGVEPVTLRLSSACSNQLSYTTMGDGWWS